MAEKRIEHRFSYRYPIFYGMEGTPHIGHVKNLSESGLAVSSKTVFSPGVELDMVLQTDLHEIELVGKVRWTIRNTNNVPDSESSQMGISLMETSSDYMKFFNKIANEFRELRSELRFNKEFKIQFENPKHLVDQYSQNIGVGGMFVNTDIAFDIGSIVKVKIIMADINTHIEADARVVHKVTELEAEKNGSSVGIGLEIIKFGAGKSIYQSYMNKWISSD